MTQNAAKSTRSSSNPGRAPRKSPTLKTVQSASTIPPRLLSSFPPPASENSYPYLTKRQIREQLEVDDVFVLQCLQILWERQTETERDRKITAESNNRGFMSSHAVQGSMLAQEAALRGELSKSDMVHAREIVTHYSKQLAEHFRTLEAASNPAVRAQASVFGV